MKKETAQRLLALSEREYDTYAREFSDSRAFFWKELEFLDEHVQAGQTVLDVGCGNGRLVDFLGAKKRISYTGIDSSKGLTNIATQERGDKGTFIHASALSLPFNDGTFDRVFSIAVLHHVPSQAFREQFVREARRVLKQDGTLVLTVWYIWQWRFFTTHLAHIMRKLTFRSDLDWGDVIMPFGKMKNKRYVHAFTKKSLERLLEQNGFTVSSIKEVKRKSGYANLVAIARKQGA